MSVCMTTPREAIRWEILKKSVDTVHCTRSDFKEHSASSISFREIHESQEKINWNFIKKNVCNKGPNAEDVAGPLAHDFYCQKIFDFKLFLLVSKESL